MKKYLKYIVIGILVGIVIAFLIAFISQFFNLGEKLVSNIFLTIGSIGMIAGLAYNYFYIRKYRKRVIYQLDLLEKHKLEEALKDMQSMYQEVSNKGAKHIARLVKLNTSAAYCDLKEYNKALNVLLELSSEKFTGIEDLVYRLNLCACYFYLGNFEACISSYATSKQVFEMYRKYKNYSGNIAIIKIMVLMAENKFNEAHDLPEQTKHKWRNPRLLDDYQLIENRLKEQETLEA